MGIVGGKIDRGVFSRGLLQEGKRSRAASLAIDEALLDPRLGRGRSPLLLEELGGGHEPAGTGGGELSRDLVAVGDGIHGRDDGARSSSEVADVEFETVRAQEPEHVPLRNPTRPQAGSDALDGRG
jgi:hypothetical protein